MMKILKTSMVSLCLGFFLLSCDKEESMIEPGNLVPKTVMEDPTLPSVTINEAKLHAIAFGHPDSTLIVCIHGGPGANFRYMLNCKSLADKGYRVVFYDQRGSGLSERLAKQWYLKYGVNAVEKVFYDELKGVINQYRTHPSQKVVLLTQSWGSMLGTGYAGKYPNDIDGLILAEPGGLRWEDVLEYVGKSQAFGLFSEAFNDVTYADQFITGRENQHEILDYKLALMTANDVLVGDIKSNLGTNRIFYKSGRVGAVVQSAMFEIGEKYKPDFSEGIAQFQKKVLFFYSSNNKAYPDSWAQKISGVYPNKELVKVQGVGHSGMFDQIDTWAKETEPKVLAYLNSL